MTGSHGMPPFIDMGVWGPFGDGLAAAMKFSSQAWQDGQWKASKSSRLGRKLEEFQDSCHNAGISPTCS